MRSEDMISSFGEIARAKDIDRDTLQLIVEDVMRAMIRKRYGSDEAFEIIFNPEQGDIQILHIREVVANMNLEDPVTEIEVGNAKDIDPDFEVGDEVASELSIADFGRRAVMMGRQTFRQSIRDLEKEKIYEEYSELVGEIVVGEIYQVRRHETLLMHEGTELVLPRSEQIPHDHYRKGNMLRTVVKEVKRDAGSDPQVVVSRTDPIFMERLFEIEVPEIYEGIVEIKEIARIPGDRAKVAVVSHDERVDPVGACVGVKGVRIHAVVRELANENIDVLQWSDDPHELIGRALSPAKPVDVKLNRNAEPPRARVEVVADEVSQAIGKGGVNIRLASQLTGFEIDVYREIPADEEDIDIEEFGDELTEETISKLKRIGCDTGKAVLELSVDELARRAELNRDTAERVLDIIKTEFEEGPGLVQQLERGRFTIQAPSTEADGAAEEAEEEAAGSSVNAENGTAAGADSELVEEVEDVHEETTPSEEGAPEEEKEAEQ
ncbi:MAG: transcription termination/antitermination protein NusA [Bacteroidetes bacterium]|nr:transcription termination/antitermination protein NusA [Bacteroidota bacterium]